MLYTLNEKYGLTFYDVKSTFPNTSFSEKQVLNNFPSVEAYEESPKPEHQWYQKVVEDAPINGVQQWRILESSEEEKAALTGEMSTLIRDTRKGLLAASDWTQVADAPVSKQAWADYRQALRDITSQAGFPWDVQWPTQPE